MRKVAAALATAGFFVYPAAVYFGLQYFEPRLLAGLLLLLVLLRLAATRAPGLFSRAVQPGGKVAGITSRPAQGLLKGQAVLVALLLLVSVSYTMGSNSIEGLKFYPLVVSVCLLLSFGYSVLFPPTVIERIARLSEPALSDAGIRYTRLVTLVWCGFFFFNSLVVLYSIYRASFEFWALYNGFVSYLLIGGLLGGEYLYRVLAFKRRPEK